MSDQTTAEVLWVAGTNRTTGRPFLANNEGQRFDFDADQAAGIAACLSEYCTDNGERAFVRDEWDEVWDDEDEEDGPDV